MVTATAACDGLRGEPGITARLYFGRARTDDAAWQKFLAERVTPRFPSGFSVFDGYGQWRQRSTGRIAQERSTVIEICRLRDPEDQRAIVFDILDKNLSCRETRQLVQLVVKLRSRSGADLQEHLTPKLANLLRQHAPFFARLQ